MHKYKFILRSGTHKLIRKFKKDDLKEVLQIWLKTNIKSHSFISEKYWNSSLEYVKKALPHSEIYVYEIDGTIHGFIGMENNYIAGIFVREKSQSIGLGKQLLDHAKRIKQNLSLNVYAKNVRAVKFYIRENFKAQSEQVDSNTKEVEYLMTWNSSQN